MFGIWVDLISDSVSIDNAKSELSGVIDTGEELFSSVIDTGKAR
jgi:hypothetical protein